jgi:glucose-fructose oxidoreductase
MKRSPKHKRIRYAVVGLGHLAQAVVLPAFANARKNSELGALITGDPNKARTLSRKYGVPAFDYLSFEQALREQEIDAVYIALPNHQHREYTERAARAGVHVLCEKPMANTEADCRAMISACNRARVKLMIAYRLHFNTAHLEAIKLVRSGKLGEVRFFSSIFGMNVKEGNIRTRRATGGGTLFDIGVYCINAARYLFEEQPVEAVSLTASKTDDARFAEIEEMASALLRFPGERLAQFTCSFGSASASELEVVGTKGSLRISRAFDYKGELRWLQNIGGKSKEKRFAPSDQFAPELLYFSDCILKDKAAEPDGFAGWADVRIINAIYKSAKSGRPVHIKPVLSQKRPIRKEQDNQMEARKESGAEQGATA